MKNKESKRDILKRLYIDNGLIEEDIFMMSVGGKEIPIVTRQGVEKIQQHNGIHVRFEWIFNSDDCKCVIIKAIGAMGEATIETFGEASPSNTKQSYPVAMAEKRAKARAILQLAGFYTQGVYSEDEFK